MSEIDPQALYTENHEWIRVEGDQAVCGISDHAQHALSDIVYVELPEVGATFAQGDSFGVVESVKAAADCYLPASGEIVAVNDELEATPELVNSEPYTGGWLVKIALSNPDELKGLMDAAAYKIYLDKLAEEE